MGCKKRKMIFFALPFSRFMRQPPQTVPAPAFKINLRKDCAPADIPETGAAERAQTHIAWIFLTNAMSLPSQAP